MGCAFLGPQSLYAERGIGSIRRECPDHLVVIGEQHLLGILSKYVDYYNGPVPTYCWPRTHPSHGVCSRLARAVWWRCPAWVGSITNTSGERREPIGRISGRHRGVHGPLRVVAGQTRLMPTAARYGRPTSEAHVPRTRPRGLAGRG